MADIWGSSNIGGSGSSTATLPDQITNLACVGGTDGTAGTIDISFTEVPSTSWDLLKNYVVVYKEGSIPQTPFDGYRIVIEKGIASTNKTYQITGLTFDQLYGVRIYPVSTKNQYQTATEDATASATPIAGINSGTLSVASKIAIPVKSAYQSKLGTEIIWKIADQNHTGYPANSTNLISDKIIALLAFDATEPTNPDTHRQINGNNRYLHSNQLHWLNSLESDGTWYAAQHTYDASPASTRVSGNPYDTWAGFLHMLNDNFVAYLLDTTVTVAKNTVIDGGGSETVTAKMQLLSSTEVGFANENDIVEGVKFPIFTDSVSRIAYCTQAAIDTATDATKPTTTLEAWHFWFRTSDTPYTYAPRFVNSTGVLDSTTARTAHIGVRPLCNIPNTFKLNPTPREDGCYIPI